MTITLTREEAQQVLDALSGCREDSEELFYDYKQKYGDHYKPQRITFQQSVLDQSAQAIEILRDRLSAPEPEPVADKYLMEVECTKCGAKQDGVLTVTVPPQPEPHCKTGSQCIGGKCPQCVAREWQELTENEKELLWDEAVEGREHFCSQYGNFADAIEAKLKEKNHE